MSQRHSSHSERLSTMLDFPLVVRLREHNLLPLVAGRSNVPYVVEMPSYLTERSVGMDIYISSHDLVEHSPGLRLSCRVLRSSVDTLMYLMPHALKEPGVATLYALRGDGTRLTWCDGGDNAHGAWMDLAWLVPHALL